MNTKFIPACTAILFCLSAWLPAGTLRHQVNPTLASGDPDVSNPIPSPDGTKIYFTTDYIEAVDAEWYWVPATGGAATLLAQAGPSRDALITSDGAYLVGESSYDLISLSTTTGTAVTLGTMDSSSDWKISADGKWVAYENDDALFVVSVSGGTPVEVTPSGSSPSLDSWDFLPDSTAVIFQWAPDFAEDRVFAYPLPLGSGSRVELTDSTGGYADEFAIAPDSSRVVYEQDDVMHSIKPDGSSRVSISGSIVSVQDLIVSADSTLVCWHDSYDDRLYKTSLTSNTSTSLITSGTVEPDFFCGLGITPDGSHLVFSGVDGSRNDLYSLSIAGGTPVRISNASPSAEPITRISGQSFLFLPNSQRILYLCDDDNSGTVDLMSGKIDGSGSVRLDRDSLAGSDLSTSFSGYGFQYIAHVVADSSYVIYPHDELVSGRTDVFAIHPGGTGRTKLNSTLSTDSDAYPVTYADDDSFLIYAGDHNSDFGTELWKVTLPGFAASQLVDLTDVSRSAHFVHASADSSTLFYSAYQDSPENAELYAVPYTGGTPIKVSGALPAGYHLALDIEDAPGGANVVYDSYDYGFGYRAYRGASDGSGSSLMVQKNAGGNQFTPDGSTVFFRAESPTVSGQYLLYRQYFAGGPSVRVSSATQDVDSFKLSPDGTTLVMIASDSGGASELFSIPVAGGAQVKLNPVLTSGGNVASFSISPDSTKVVFIADAVTDTHDMLFAVPIGGGSTTVLEAATVGGVDDFAISPDSSKVVFVGDVETDYIHDLFAVSISGGTKVMLNFPLYVFFSTSTVEEFEITADSARVVYRAERDWDVAELFSTKLDGSDKVKLNSALVAEGDVESFQVSADGSWVAYYADQGTDGTYELFHVASTGGTATRLHPAYASTRDVSWDYEIIGSDRVIFRADHGGSDDQIRLFCTKVPDFITNRLDNNTLAAGDVASFEAPENGAYVAYLADQNTDGSNDVFVVYGVPDITPIANQIGLINLPLGPRAFTVSDLESPATNLVVTATSSNHTLLPDGGITLGGSGSARTLTLLPTVGQWGLTTVTVKVSDGIHESQMSFEVRIIPDPNDLPSGVNLSPNSVVENAPVGTPVGILHTLDADAWDIHTYTLVGGSTTKFTIAGDQLLTNDVFDYETTSAYSIVVRSTDFVGAYYDAIIVVGVIDLSGQPQDFSRVGPVNQRFSLNDGEFRDNFALHDGPALERIRIETVPAHGQLVLRFPEELIDGSITGPRAIVAGDLNGDTRADLVVAGSSGGTHVLVWYEQVLGAVRFPVPAGLHVIDSGAAIGQINDVALADLDRDGDLDLVATCGTPNNKAYLYRNMGGAPPVFVRSTLTTVPNNPVSVSVGKIDADPEWDIVIASSGDNSVRTYRRNGTIPGLFYFPVDLVSAAEPGVAEIALADFDKDGRSDIACADPTSSEVVWLRNNGGSPPTFARQVASNTMTGASSLAVGDLNKDGNFDIAIASRTGSRIDWLKSNGAAPPVFTRLVISPTFNTPTAITLSDLDGDTDQDLVALSATDGKVVMLENNGTPTPLFMPLDIDRDCAGASCVFAGDLDADGKPEIAAGADTANDLSWYRNSSAMLVGTEVDIDETQKLFYMPNLNYVGTDSFDWRGHDGVQWSFDAATVTFSIYGNEYWNWLVANFTLPVISDPAQRTTVWGSSADADHDGVNNITEYALNGNPNSASSIPNLSAKILPDSGLDYLFASYLFRKNEVSLTYTLEVSTDLSVWHSGGGYFTPITPDIVIDALFNQVTYKDLNAVSANPTQFVRLRIGWALD